MAASTNNYNLTKPSPEDFYDIEVQNENLEVIDGKLKELETGVDQVRDGFEGHLGDYVRQPGAGATTGSANTYSLTLSPVPTAYVDGMGIVIKIHVDSTAASTINVNALGAKPLKKANGTDVTNLKAGGIYTFRYNSTAGNFMLQGEGGEYGNATAADVKSGVTFGTETGLQTGTNTNKKYYFISTTITPNGAALLTISGLPFTPSRALVVLDSSAAKGLLSFSVDTIYNYKTCIMTNFSSNNWGAIDLVQNTGGIFSFYNITTAPTTILGYFYE